MCILSCARVRVHIHLSACVCVCVTQSHGGYSNKGMQALGPGQAFVHYHY